MIKLARILTLPAGTVRNAAALHKRVIVRGSVCVHALEPRTQIGPEFLLQSRAPPQGHDRKVCGICDVAHVPYSGLHTLITRRGTKVEWRRVWIRVS